MKIIAKDEMECLIKGLDWLITKILKKFSL